MILCLGEILADLIAENDGGSYKMFCGGAPFNVAANIKFSGGNAGFIGKTGKDIAGHFISKYARRVNLDFLNIFKDNIRNTTMAFVSIGDDGEREFCFFKHDTADIQINAEDINLSDFCDLNIVHLGSLMLREKCGQKTAKNIVLKIKKAKKLFSFDVNFRNDLFNNTDELINAYKYFIDNADILKFSEDEIKLYTGQNDLDQAVKTLYKKNRLLLVTLGSKGSMYIYNDKQKTIPSEKITPIDTTGAGDAFYGALLSKIDGVDLNALSAEEFDKILSFANSKGAQTTLFKGAIKIIE